eukprot:jgi/Tetstr1/450196/TSEL_037235.t2
MEAKPGDGWQSKLVAACGCRQLPLAAVDIVNEACWEAHVRNAWRSVQGPVCIFEINDVNIADFCQGDILLVEQDLLAVLPPEVAEDVMCLLKHAGLADAFHVRRELVNYKKVCLNVYQDSDRLEKDIRQMCSFFHGSDAQEMGDYHVHSDRYTELCQTMNECKGAVAVISDTRRLTKSLCCVPRFPNKGVPSMLLEAPNCMKAWRDVERAVYYINHDVKPASKSERRNARFENLCEHMLSWGYPTHVLEYIKLVLIARGAAKALWMVDEAKLLHKALQAITAKVDTVCAKLVTLPRAGDIVEELKACSTSDEAEGLRRKKREQLMEAIHGQRFQATMRGMVSILHDATRWIGEISVSHVDSKKLFLAGDHDRAHGTTMFTPDGFETVPKFESFRAVCEKYRPEMYAAIKEQGWPPPEGSFKTKMLKGETKCRVCNAKYASLWIHRGICVSCDECGMFYADGDDVQCLVDRFQPVAIYLDFDRTLCTTRGGGSPLIGNHSLDPGLTSVLSCAPETATVVTRNSYREDIKKFMEMKGMGKAKIFTTKKHQSKADAMLDPAVLQPGQCILFVDDTIAELIDPRLTSKYHRGQLKRVLFSRARI